MMVEEELGFFDLALSFTSEAQSNAETMLSFAEFYQLKCYYYQEWLIRQTGLVLSDILAHVYRTSRNIVVINSRSYGTSPATALELHLIGLCEFPRRVHVIEMGGKPLLFPNVQVSRYSGFTDEVAVQIVGACKTRG